MSDDDVVHIHFGEDGVRTWNPDDAIEEDRKRAEDLLNANKPVPNEHSGIGENQAEVTENILRAVLESSRLRELVKEVVKEQLVEVEESKSEQPLRIESPIHASTSAPSLGGILSPLGHSKPQFPRRNSHVAERKDDVEVHVHFEANTWSSFYMFFVTLEDGRGLYTPFEKFMILATIALTWLVQGLLVAVTLLRMTENPYEQGIVEQILRYRVLHGHSFANVQSETGKTFMDNFCNENTAPWSWESEEFETMTKYLDGTIPGWILSVLSLIGWVSCCAFEFRALVEQALATINLERPHKVPHRKCLQLDEENMQVLSMSMTRKMGVLMLISVPRMIIMCTLCYTGCVYLSYTASLEDLVLNAMALIFVIEFDELVYAVFVTARAQRIVASAQPMTFPVYQLPGGIVLKDTFRVALCWVTVALSISQFLLPFIDSVAAARDALCGGDTSLSYNAPTALSFIHVVQHGQDVAQCPTISRAYGNYLKEMYNESSSLESKADPPDPADVQDERIRLLLEYVYRDQGKDNLPDMLTTALSGLNAKSGGGSSAQPAACSRFDPSKGVQTCLEAGGSGSEASCAWDYRSYLCEGWPSLAENRVKERACASKPMSTFSCRLWENAGYRNPYSFCQWEKISGSFTIYYGNLTQDERRALQGGLDIIYTSTIYVGILGQFVGWNGIAGSVRRATEQERRLQAKGIMDGEVDQVQMPPASMPERRLGHQPRSEVRYTLPYEILIPFPNTAFHFPALEIYNDLKDLASNTSKASKRMVEIFEQKFTELTKKQIPKGCLLAVEDASEPVWTAWDAPVTNESTATCSDQCVDLHGWSGYNSQGDIVDCAFVEAKGWCANGAPDNGQTVESLAVMKVGGVNVVDACCACGGGSTAA